MEEILKRKIVEVGSHRLMEEVSCTWPSDKRVQEMVVEQLMHCGVRAVRVEFKNVPVMDETMQEVDRVFTGDVIITLECYAWGDFDKKGGESGKEKNNG